MHIMLQTCMKAIFEAFCMRPQEPAKTQFFVLSPTFPSTLKNPQTSVQVSLQNWFVGVRATCTKGNWQFQSFQIPTIWWSGERAGVFSKPPFYSYSLGCEHSRVQSHQNVRGHGDQFGQSVYRHCTEMHFAKFLSGAFDTITVIFKSTGK